MYLYNLFNNVRKSITIEEDANYYPVRKSDLIKCISKLLWNIDNEFTLFSKLTKFNEVVREI